jgi:hypothetical protein
MGAVYDKTEPQRASQAKPEVASSGWSVLAEVRPVLDTFSRATVNSRRVMIGRRRLCPTLLMDYCGVCSSGESAVKQVTET